jgi:hypothetical protein
MTFTTHPTWHEEFLDELNDLSSNDLNTISAFTSSSRFTIKIKFQYKLYKLRMSLTFYDNNAKVILSMLPISGTRDPPSLVELIPSTWGEWEYSDPKFTPKTVFDTIKERTERWEEQNELDTRNRQETPRSK